MANKWGSGCLRPSRSRWVGGWVGGRAGGWVGEGGYPFGPKLAKGRFYVKANGEIQRGRGGVLYPTNGHQEQPPREPYATEGAPRIRSYRSVHLHARVPPRPVS
jgi:hypothetical protein